MATKKPKSGYILTDQGLCKLKDAISKQYGKSYKQKLAEDAGVDRNTVSKVVEKKGGCHFETIADIFSALNLDLEYNEKNNNDQNNDCIKVENFPQTEKKPTQTSTKTTPSQQLKEALHTLNYGKLDGFFETSVKERSVQGFLIQGKYGYGQKWLINRLARHINYNVRAYPVRLEIKNKLTIDDFWETLGNKIGCQPDPEAIAQQIYQYWLTQPVILSIWNFNKVAQGKGLEIFINQVWQLVVTYINNHPSSNLSQQVVLFIVDQTGNIQFSSDFIINLPQIHDLASTDITDWVRTSLSNLLIEFNNHSISDIEDSIQDIIGKNTTPLYALEAICEHCNLNYYSDIEGSFNL